MRGVRALVAVAVPSLMLMGCAGVGAKTAEAPAKGASAYEGTPEGPLKVMGFSGEDEVAQSRIAAFKQSAPKVQVTNNKGDFDAQQFLTALASGNPPDLVYMDRNLVGTYAAKGAIQPMTDCIAQQKIDMSQYRPAAMTPITLDKVVYGIPEFYVVTTNLVDKRVVAKAGLQLSDIQTADWAKLEATAKKLSEVQGGKIRRLGYDSKMPDSFPLWAMANGAQIVKPDGSPNINDPKAVEALDFNLRLVKEQGGWNSYKAFRDSFDIFGAKNPLTVDQAGAFPMENWYVNVLRDSIGKGLQLGFDHGDGPPGHADQQPRRQRLGDPQGREEPQGRVRLGQDDDRAGHVDEGRRGPDGHGHQGQELLHRPVHREQAGGRGDQGQVPQGGARPRLRAGDQQRLRLARRRRRAFPPPAPAPRSMRRGRAASPVPSPGSPPRPHWTRLRRRHRPPSTRRPHVARRRGLQRRESRAAYLFLSPWIIGFLVFTAGPMVVSLVLSFTDYQLVGPSHGVGTANYRELAADPRIAKSLLQHASSTPRCSCRSARSWRWAWPCCCSVSAALRGSSGRRSTCRS